jgi:metal-dependent amidase/aminoacylase/carboxypeptidase family protein
MDALPVTELVDLPFASKVRTIYDGQEVGVMHACGHDNHVAILTSGAVAEVVIGPGVPVTYNDPALTEMMIPTLRRVARDGNARVTNPGTCAEDFSFFQEKIPGLYFGLGVTPDGIDMETVAGTHSPMFFADEAALPIGVRAMTHLAVDYLTASAPAD